MLNSPSNVLINQRVKTLRRVDQVLDFQSYIILEAPLEEVYEEEIIGHVEDIQEYQYLHIQDPDNTIEISEYDCDSCDETFNTNAALVVHKTEQSIIKTRAALRDSGTKTSKKTVKNIQDSKDTIEIFEYHCDSCDETFNTNADLVVHKTEQSIIKTRAALRDSGTTTSKRTVKNIQDSKDTIEIFEYHCDSCDETFNTNADLVVHKTEQYIIKTSSTLRDPGTKTSKKTVKNIQDSKDTIEIFEYHCDSCDETFNTNAALVVHKTEQSIIKTRSALRDSGTTTSKKTVKDIQDSKDTIEIFKYHCDSCNETFNTNAALVVHKTEKSIIKTRAALRESGTITSKKTVKNIQDSKDTIEMVEYLYDSFQDSQGPQEATEIPEYFCDSCDETFDTDAARVVHKTEQSIIKTRATLRGSKKPTVKKNFNEWFFEQRSTIERQKNAHKPSIKQNLISKIKTESRIEKDNSIEFTNDPQEDESDDDNQTSVPESSMKKSGKKTKQEIGPVECNICLKKFKKQKYLNVHEGIHNSPFVCHICGAKLTSAYYLNMHIKRHNKEFSYFCQVCQKGFYLRANLKIHMTSHTEDKPCICEVCHKTFGNSLYLKNHMKLHDEPSTRKKYNCEICPFETFYSYCMKEHRSTHTGEGLVSCEFCGKLIRKQYMKTHIRIHTGEKPEMCEFCGKAFSAKKYLIKHRRTHTGEKPYQCHICEKRFTQRSTLTAHLRRHEIPK